VQNDLTSMPVCIDNRVRSEKRNARQKRPDREHRYGDHRYNRSRSVHLATATSGRRSGLQKTIKADKEIDASRVRRPAKKLAGGTLKYHAKEVGENR
jgi:hypothetical protein